MSSCLECGTESPYAAPQCPFCGAPLAPIEAERKLVTVLFADVVGATRLGEALDVESLRELFELVFAAMQEEASRTGGLCQLLGDAVMALYGVPATHENDIDRALSAAVAMLERLDEINERIESTYGDRVELRIGVNTGEVMVPTGRRVDPGRLTGDTLNVAARLQAAAEPGGIMVAQRTARGSRSFLFEDRGLLTVRGRTEPVHGLELAGVRSAPHRSTPLIRAPLIGRSLSLDDLRSAWQSAIDGRRAVMLTVVGAAGVGKSRLVAEFVDQVADQARFMKGRCLPFGEELALRPLADMWREEIGALESDPPELVRAKIAKLVDELVDSEHQEAANVGLAHTLAVSDDTSGAEVAPRAVATLVRTAWRLLLEQLASARPVLVVLEDLHWADPSLLDLVDGLACCIESPVMFLCTTRPSLLEQTPDASIGSRVGIGPLPASDAESLFDALMQEPTSSDALRREVLAKAEGNPLFMEEILRHLIDKGRLVRAAEGWRVGSDVGEVLIPDTIQAVLASRIDLLEPGEKLALQCAAVIGRVFWLEGVADLLRRSLAETDRLLAGLADRDLIRAMDSHVGRSYLFNHVLARDVAYASLPRRRRSELHDGVVEWLEGASSMVRPDLLAHHAVRSFEEAGHVLSLTAEDQDRLRKRALSALLQASAAFRTGNSIETARHYARRASLLVAEPAEEARVEEALGETAYFNYEGDEAWLHLRKAMVLLDRSGTSTPRELARLAGRALETPLRRPGIMVHHPSEGEVAEHLTRALEWAGDGDSAERARLLMLMSFWRHAYPGSADRPALVSDERALMAGEEAASMAQRVARPDIESAALDGVSANHIPDSNYAEAWKATHRRLALTKDIHDPEEIGDIHAMQCWIDFHRGHYRETHHFAQAGYEVTIDQVPSVALHCVAWRGMSSFRLGDWDAVVADLAIAEEILGEHRPAPPYFASGLWAVAAVVHDLRGDRESSDRIMATLTTSVSRGESSDTVPLGTWIEFLGPMLARRRQTDMALRLNRETRFRRGTRRGLLFQAECDTMLAGSRFDGASDVAAATRAFGEAMGLEALGPAADRLEGAALLVGGRTMDAARLLRRAEMRFSKLDAVYDLALTEVLLAQALDEAGSPDPGLLHRSTEILRGLGIAELPSGEPA